ncbi:MAG: hypothetical protein ACLSWY_07775 [Ruthenibacterium lactatiformans]
MMTTVDYKKNVPVLGSYEVVVAGAGQAGIVRRWQRPAAGRAWRWWNVTEYWEEI